MSRLTHYTRRHTREGGPLTAGAVRRFGFDRLAEMIGSSATGARITGTAFDSWATYLVENPVVMGAFLERVNMFRQIRFAFADLDGKLDGTARSLAVLRRPWPGGRSSHLLARMELDATRHGNAFIYRPPADPTRLYMWDPAHVSIIRDRVEDADGRLIGEETVGYMLTDPTNPSRPVVALAGNGELAHYMPIPDPRRPWRGMSWLEPGRRDVFADDLMTRHRLAYFERAATPNLIVKSAANLTDEQYEALEQRLDELHSGVENAYRTLILEGALEVDALGNSLHEATFSTTQDAGEGRIILASRVPAPLVGIQLGANPTYNNHSSARRQFADAWARPAWQDAVECLEAVVPVPPRFDRLWYTERHIAALQQDAADAAKIAQADAATMRTLIDGGFVPDSVTEAVQAGYDWGQLEHTGRVSVQLLEEGNLDEGSETPPADPFADDDDDDSTDGDD